MTKPSDPDPFSETNPAAQPLPSPFPAYPPSHVDGAEDAAHTGLAGRTNDGAETHHSAPHEEPVASYRRRSLRDRMESYSRAYTGSVQPPRPAPPTPDTTVSSPVAPSTTSPPLSPRGSSSLSETFFSVRPSGAAFTLPLHLNQRREGHPPSGTTAGYGASSLSDPAPDPASTSASTSTSTPASTPASAPASPTAPPSFAENKRTSTRQRDRGWNQNEDGFFSEPEDVEGTGGALEDEAYLVCADDEDTPHNDPRGRYAHEDERPFPSPRLTKTLRSVGTTAVRTSCRVAVLCRDGIRLVRESPLIPATYRFLGQTGSRVGTFCAQRLLAPALRAVTSRTVAESTKTAKTATLREGYCAEVRHDETKGGPDSRPQVLEGEKAKKERKEREKKKPFLPSGHTGQATPRVLDAQPEGGTSCLSARPAVLRQEVILTRVSKQKQRTLPLRRRLQSRGRLVGLKGIRLGHRIADKGYRLALRLFFSLMAYPVFSRFAKLVLPDVGRGLALVWRGGVCAGALAHRSCLRLVATVTGIGHWHLRFLRMGDQFHVMAAGLGGGLILTLLAVWFMAHRDTGDAVVSPLSDAQSLALIDKISQPVAVQDEVLQSLQETSADAEKIEQSFQIDPQKDNSVGTFIEAAPGQTAVIVQNGVEGASSFSPPPPLSPQTFQFEMFSGRDQKGRTVLQQQKVREIISEWFPAGSKATDLMRFFGSVVLRAQGNDAEDLKKLVQKHCLHMPNNKVFTQRTIVCTYGYTMPRSAPAIPEAPVLWIVSLSYDNAERLTALEVHARETPRAKGSN